MKKILSILLALVMSSVLFVSLSACSEIEDGSKIQRMKMVLEYKDADGVATERTVELKLYLNFAPRTCENFIKLAEEGFYNGVVVSNLQTSWLEFGAYKYVDGALTRCDGDKQAIKGEFSKNGVKGNPLMVSGGALIMKRNYSLDTDTESAYDTAKTSVIVALTSLSKFNSSEYCVFGKICTDDEAFSYTSDSETVTLTSLKVLNGLNDYITDSEGVKTYYYEPDGSYYCTKYDDESSTTKYYKGATVDAANEITDDEGEEKTDLTDFKKKLNEESYNFLILPYTQITIKSITKK